MGKTRSRFLTFLIVFSMIMSMGVSFAEGVYELKEPPGLLDITGNSTNTHTKLIYAWNDDSASYVAVASTHELKETMTLGDDSSTKSIKYSALEEIKVGTKFYSPSGWGLIGNTNSAHWTVFEFAGFELAPGNYTISVDGIGGGHSVDAALFTISDPTPVYWTVTFVDWDGSFIDDEEVL
ncbi:hypothetical protein, partial [Gudongella sp. SC589]|uniref:hypothetical protein n=1 Tax=Gudongella sp. SC589 TaxID=3385990 RepID=UPI0039047B89